MRSFYNCFNQFQIGVDKCACSSVFRSIWADYLTPDPAAWTVRIGEYNMSSEEGTHEDIRPTKIILHPRRDRECVHLHL